MLLFAIILIKFAKCEECIEERQNCASEQSIATLYVAAVVHHGGAGTTACGLINGRPTTIVTIFGE